MIPRVYPRLTGRICTGLEETVPFGGNQLQVLQEHNCPRTQGSHIVPHNIFGIAIVAQNFIEFLNGSYSGTVSKRQVHGAFGLIPKAHHLFSLEPELSVVYVHNPMSDKS
ncbi:hypothetical protein GN956_G3636 [Arapaima gigas]